MVYTHKAFVQQCPVATKRVLRAILKAADLCTSGPERVARFLVDKGYTTCGKWQRQWRRDDQSERSLYGPPGDYKRGEFGSINVYYCTALMLDRLRIKIGTREFNRLVRAWPQTHRNSNQTRSSFVSWWENRSGEELSAFFHLWLMSRKSPA